MQQELFEKVGKIPDHGELPFSAEETTKMALDIFVNSLNVIADLRTVLIINRSGDGYVTSDHPSVVCNKFVNQKLRLDTFGTSSSGFTIYMPLTPRMAVLSFDAGVYAIDANGNREVIVSRTADVRLLNSLVMMNDANCIYFREWRHAAAIAELIAAAVQRRCAGTRTVALRPIEGQNGSFRPLSPGESYEGGGMVLSEAIYPHPLSWPSFFRNKVRQVTYSEGTAIGHVRKKEWLRRPADEVEGSLRDGSRTR
jgi:hypothetical protein